VQVGAWSLVVFPSMSGVRKSIYVSARLSLPQPSIGATFKYAIVCGPSISPETNLSSQLLLKINDHVTNHFR